MQDPLITWPVQVSRREARKLSAALELHQKLCHVNASDMHHAFPSLTALQLQAILQCSVCAACKMHRRPFKAVPAEHKATRPGAILSMDLSYWPTPSPGGAKHLLVLHDQFSTLIACAPLIRKSNATDVIQQFILTSEKSFGIGIAVVHCDQGGKFKNSALQSFCTKRGIMIHLTAAYTAMQNGTVERANRTIGNAVRAMLTGGGMEAKHWAEAACSLEQTTNAMPRIFFSGKFAWERYTGQGSGCGCQYPRPERARRSCATCYLIRWEGLPGCRSGLRGQP